MVVQPSPEEQRAADAARAWEWEKIRGKNARFLEHLYKDCFDKGFSAAWAARGKYEESKRG